MGVLTSIKNFNGLLMNLLFIIEIKNNVNFYFLIYLFRGEVIPIRIYLAGIDVTPSSKNVSGKFTVKHFINLVLVDEDDRRYFK